MPSDEASTLDLDRLYRESNRHEASWYGEGGVMTTTEICLFWVVYQVTIHGNPSGINAVCEQGEWDAMERDRPGYHKLVR